MYDSKYFYFLYFELVLLMTVNLNLFELVLTPFLRDVLQETFNVQGHIWPQDGGTTARQKNGTCDRSGEKVRFCHGISLK